MANKTQSKFKRDFAELYWKKAGYKPMSFYDQAAEQVWSLLCLDPEETMWGMDREGFAKHLKRGTRPIPVTVHYCAINGGDGSAYPAFFKSAGEAECREDHESGYEGFCEATGSETFYVTGDGDIQGQLDYTWLDDDHSTEEWL